MYNKIGSFSCLEYDGHPPISKVYPRMGMKRIGDKQEGKVGNNPLNMQLTAFISQKHGYAGELKSPVPFSFSLTILPLVF